MILSATKDRTSERIFWVPGLQGVRGNENLKGLQDL